MIIRPSNLMRISLSCIAPLALCAGIATGQTARVPQTPVLSIADGGLVGSQKLYSLKAENADVAEALKQLFSRMGNYSLEMTQEVRGSTFTLTEKSQSLEYLIRQVQNAAVPPVYVSTNGRVVYVTRSPDAASRAEQVRQMMDTSNARKVPGIVPSGLQTIGGGVFPSAFYNKVSLSVPEKEPITLAEALMRLERQSGLKIVLDKSISPDVKFTGTVVRTPVLAVLQNIAPGTGDAALKMIAQGNQVVIAPTDRFSVFFSGGLPVASTLSCSKCQQPLFGVWSYCPGCGQVTRRGQLQGLPSAGSAAGSKKAPYRPE